MIQSMLRVIAATWIGAFIAWWLFAGVCVVPGLSSSELCAGDRVGALLWPCIIVACIASWALLEWNAARKRSSASEVVTESQSAARKIFRWGFLAVAGACSLFVVLLFCSLVFGGVMLPGTPWRQENFAGPMLMDDKRAETVTRCSVFAAFMSNGTCEDAFVDHRGKKVVVHDIQHTADDALEKIPALAPWVALKRKDGSCCSSPIRNEAPYEMPYAFYIVTISPTVVLAAPHVGYDPNISCGSRFSGGCMGSRRSRVGYFYRREIPVVAGSFAFFPDQPERLEAAPSDSRQWVIALNDSELRFLQENGVWKVTRVRGKR